MEIEKKRETSWKIDLKKKNEKVELTSVEISGEVRLIKLALIKDDKSINVDMNKEEFFNFLSLISAFKDVVIGEDPVISEERFSLNDKKEQKFRKISNLEDNAYQMPSESSEKEFQNHDNEKLNPEEWDPW